MPVVGAAKSAPARDDGGGILQTHATFGLQLVFVDQGHASRWCIGDGNFVNRACCRTGLRFKHASAHRHQPRRAAHHILRHHAAAIYRLADDEITTLGTQRRTVHDQTGVEHRRQTRRPFTRFRRVREQHYGRLAGINRGTRCSNRGTGRIRP